MRDSMRHTWMKGMATLVVVLLVSHAGFTAWAAGPANLATTTDTDSKGKVTLTWTASGTISSFTIQRIDFISGLKSYTVAGTARSFTQTGLSSANTYIYRISANTMPKSWSTHIVVVAP